MLLRLEFQERKTEIQQSLDTLHEAIDGNQLQLQIWQLLVITLSIAYTEIFASDSLKKILHIILVTGNMINAVSLQSTSHTCLITRSTLQGGHSGKAYGFTITSLDNLGDTRANKPRMTYMHYIASVSQQLANIHSQLAIQIFCTYL